MNNKTFKGLILSSILLGIVGIIGITNNQSNFSKNLQANILNNTEEADKKNQNKTRPENLANLKIPILMYHHVDFFDNSTKHNQILTYIGVSSEKLAKELDLIQNLGYTTITFQDIENNNVPTKPIILTFDDSYEDFYTKAYPELQKRNMTAITYVITNDLNTPGYLTTTQIKEMRNNRIDIGSHTLSHADLSSLSEQDLQKEISDSKAYLEKLLDQEILSFCYPYGAYNTNVRNAVEKAGYKYSTTVKPGDAKFNNLLELNRYKVYSDTDLNWYLN